MDFYEYKTSYQYDKDLSRNIARSRKLDQDPMTWYDNSVQLVRRLPIDRSGNQLSTLRAEQCWYAFGKPYYKVFPQMASAMSDVSIDIPVNQVRLPYPVFCIMLGNTARNDMREGRGPVVKSLLVSEVKVKPETDSTFRLDPNEKLPVGEDGARYRPGTTRALHVNYQFDGEWRGIPANFDYTMSLYNDNETLEQFFDRSFSMSTSDLHTKEGEYCPSKEMCKRIVSLAVATCFFGIDQHEVVMPDLPRRKVEKRAKKNKIGYYPALKELKREMNTTKMWTIGREIELPPVEVTYKKPDVTSPEQRELTHAHMRRGHMRWQKVGEGRKDKKLVFIHPILVRPDLPWASERGYRITDQNVGAQS